MNCEEKAITIEYSHRFRREFKRLAKKFRSLALDLDSLKTSLRKNPTQGASLGNNLHKVRMAIESKGGGKSGGARVITHVVIDYEDGKLTFLTIYDKSEHSSISDKELTELMQECGLL